MLATGDAFELLIGGRSDDAREVRVTTEWRVGEPLFVARIDPIGDATGRGSEVAVAGRQGAASATG